MILLVDLMPFRKPDSYFIFFSIQSQTAARIESLSVTIIETVQELREETKFKTAKVLSQYIFSYGFML